MFSTKITIVALLASLATIEGGVVAPAVAPLAYANAIPYNIPPYADSVNIVNRGLRVPYAATYAATPVLHATPLAAGVLPAPHIHAHAHGLAPAVAHGLAPAVAHGLGPAVAHAVAPTLAHGHVHALAPAVARLPVADPHALLPHAHAHAHAYPAHLGYAAHGYAHLGYSAPAYASPVAVGHALPAHYY